MAYVKHSLKRYVSALGLGVAHDYQDQAIFIDKYGSLLRTKFKYNLFSLASLLDHNASLHTLLADRVISIIKVHTLSNARLLSSQAATAIQDGCNPTILFQSILNTGKATGRSAMMLSFMLDLRARVLSLFHREKVWKYCFGRTGKQSAAVRDLAQVSLTTRMGSISVSSSIYFNNY